jgi:hypothetical protein
VRKIECFLGQSADSVDVIGGIVNRYSYLVATADLTAISFNQFPMVCMLLNGIETSASVDGKRELLDQVEHALQEHEGFRERISYLTFADDSVGAREDMARKLNVEQANLLSLKASLNELESGQAIALLERAEEVMSSDEPEEKCQDVFSKMQRRIEL